MKKFIGIILLIINIVVAVCLVLSCICCYINPEIVWWLNFFGLAYIYLLGVNLFFVGYWLLTKKKMYLLISLISILAGWNLIWRNVQFFEKKLPEEETGRAIKIISFNVHMFNQKESEQPDGSVLNVFEYLTDNDFNIICMQEFVSQHWTKNMNEKAIAGKLHKTPYSHIEYATGNLGIATFSAYPIIEKQLIYSDNTTNACMYTDVVIKTDTVRIYNVHLKSIGFNLEERDLLNNVLKREYNDSDISTFKAIIRQMASSYFLRARQVDFVADHISKSPYPVIICGDFNDPPNSYSYQKTRAGRKDAFMEAGKGRSTTYNIGRISSQRIDYILYSPFFKAYGYYSPHVHFSDHFPVITYLTKRVEN